MEKSSAVGTYVVAPGTGPTGGAGLGDPSGGSVDRDGRGADATDQIPGQMTIHDFLPPGA